jgi:hypothetical protein
VTCTIFRLSFLGRNLIVNVTKSVDEPKADRLGISRGSVWDRVWLDLYMKDEKAIERLMLARGRWDKQAASRGKG